MWEPAAEGRVKQWNQIRSSFPLQSMTLFGPGRDSGTFDYFTLATVGTESSSRNDYTASEDDTVIERGVAGDPNALGYFGYANYKSNNDNLKLVAIDSGHGCVLPSATTVADSTYQPLTRPLFIYVNLNAAVHRPEVRALARFYLEPATTKYVAQVGYVPLSGAALQNSVMRLYKGVTGSVLGGHGSVLGVKANAFDDEDEEKIRNLLVQ
jgi:phosphate transport system substrate-binding protein